MIYWYLRSKIFEFFEQQKVKRRFYPTQRFRLIDEQLLNAYQGYSPYAISKAYLLAQRAPNPYLYGETPLTTMHEIARRFNLTAEDCVIEMGAGRCRAAFFLAEVIGCTVIAIEQIHEFVEIAQTIHCPRLQVVKGDFLHADLSKATAIYLYGSHLTDEEEQKLIPAFQQLSSNVKILTVSAPLPGFEVVDQMIGRFPWGKTIIYSLRRKTRPFTAGM